jgi:hypothetical protein
MWSRYVHAMLMEMGVERCIQVDCEGMIEDYKAQSLILQSCTEEYLVQISDKNCAFDMWDYLMGLFTRRSKGKIMALHEEMRHFRMFEKEKPSSFVLRARRIVNTLRSLGEEVTELTLCNLILNGLPEEYEVDVKVQQAICFTQADVSQLQHTLELSWMKMYENK